MKEFLNYKKFYGEPLLKSKPIDDRMMKDCYNTFGCRTKHCREVCPLYNELRNEGYTSYGLHTALLSVAKGLED